MSKRKTIKWVLLALLLLLVLVLAVNHHLVWVLLKNWFPGKITLDTSADWSGGMSYERLAYADDSESQYLDLYVPESEESAPLFVLIHGGGFISGDSQTRQAQFMYRYFRDHGFACASVNYRLAGEAPWPAAVEDVRLAIRFLAENAEAYGIDASQAAVWGESAGGYLACITAVTEQAVPITALVDYYGIVDFAISTQQMREQGIPQFVTAIANSWASNLGGFSSCEEYWVRKNYADWSEEDQQALSVPYQASLGRNPGLKSLLLHGNADITVPYAQSQEMAQALREVGGEENVRLAILPGLMHAADGFYSDEQLAEVEAFLREAMGLEK